MRRLNGSRIGGFLGGGVAVRASTATSSTPHAQHGTGVFIGSSATSPWHSPVAGARGTASSWSRRTSCTQWPRPARRYLLWRRLLAAIAAFDQVDATRAAHAAGFADLAHFSRTCRRFLGYSPIALRDGGG